MHFVVKNMVCDRCKMVVRKEFENLGLHVLNISLGDVETEDSSLDKHTKEALKKGLENHGFELIPDKDDALNELIKARLIDYIEGPLVRGENVSDHLAGIFKKDYSQLSKLFSKKNRITIEKYLIKLKVEKAKQYIHEGDLNFSEIAYTLGYSNLSHLSAQFKKEVGKNLSDYKNTADFKRNPFDKIL